MKHQRNIKLSIVLVMTLLSLLAVNVITASENEPVINADLIQVDIDQIQQYQIPPTIGGYTILPGGVLEGLPADITTAPDACDTAAGSYVSPGIDAIRTTMIDFDDIVHDNKDPELVMYALYAMEANNFAELNATFNNPQDMTPVDVFPNGEVKTIGENSVCIGNDTATARLWQLDEGTWVVDTIKFNQPYDISDAWNVNPNPQMGNVQFDMPVLVEDVVVRYLMPYIEPPITTVPGGSTDKLAPEPPQHCDGTAPSYLHIGADVLLQGYGYAQYPTNISDPWAQWQFNDTQVALNDYGTQVYAEILHETPLTGIVGNLESVLLEPKDMYEGINIATVVDGPFCTSVNAEPALDTGNGVVEAPDPDHDRFYTWWKIDVNGTVGWYPEVVGQYAHWLWEQEGMFDHKLTMYYMIPVSLSETQPNTCPPSTMYAGLEVEPAIAAMNLRAETGRTGDVIGRLEMEQTVILNSGPVCDDGSNWWWTDRGFLAENDPETSTALLLPAVQKFNEAAQIEETTDETIIVTAEPTQPEPQETREPKTNDDDDDSGDDNGRTTTTREETGSDSGSSSCDPTTGRGC